MASAKIFVLGLISYTIAEPNREAINKELRNITVKDHLKQALLQDYNRLYERSFDPVSVRFHFEHLEMDDRSSKMVFHGILIVSWTDSRLRWNRSEYGNITELSIGNHQIWKPDFFHYNSPFGHYPIPIAKDQNVNIDCRVMSNGDITWTPPIKLTSICKSDLFNWPADEHTCNLVLVYPVKKTHYITLPESKQRSEDITDNPEWKLVKLTKRYSDRELPCCEGSKYGTITYRATVKRRNGITKARLLRVPAHVSFLIALIGHCLPSNASLISLLLMVTPLTILSAWLLFLSSQLPMTHSTPYILVFYSFTFYLVCISNIVSIVVLNMKTTVKTLSPAVRHFLSSKLMSILYLPKLLESDFKGSGQGDATSEDTPKVKNWMIFIIAIERISLISFITAFILTMTFY